MDLSLWVSIVSAVGAVIAFGLLMWNCKRTYANLAACSLYAADSMEIQAAVMTALGNPASTALAARLEGHRVEALADAAKNRRRAWPMPVKYAPIDV